mmetsp:Transcript_21145/g.29615  ORF Transcript_21145/g.29615 Transcript_21145/m.29615 type:complete len:120 (+) Transcript_21145:116-475(+)
MQILMHLRTTLTVLRSNQQQPQQNFLLTNQTIRHATKKAGGSSSNGRDSAGRRLGIKVNHGLNINAGGIIIRQRGSRYKAGENVGMGKDHTLFAKSPGIVQFTKHEWKHKRKVVSVVSA